MARGSSTPKSEMVAREVPQDPGERDHRHDRGDRAERQRAVAGLMRSVWLRTGHGGEDVDVGLDALIGVVDGLVDEPAPVVGALVQPVAGEPIGQPRSPGQHEALRDEQIDQDAGDEDRRQQREDISESQKPQTPESFTAWLPAR